MIAADTSTWIAYFEGDRGHDTAMLENALQDGLVLMVPAVLTEILSDPNLPPEIAATLCEVPLVDTGAEYWRRAGELRARVLAKRRKARLGDALIAQSCIDRKIPLVTRDRDFKAFAESADLDLVMSAEPG